MKRILFVAALTAAVAVPAVGAVTAVESIDPSSVEEILYPGGSIDVTKTVGTAEIPPKVDVCLLQDETGSFGDDIGNLQGAGVAAAIFASVVSVAPDSQFAVAGFRDYSDPVTYELLSSMSPDLPDWETGINALSASGGGDPPEAGFDAISSAVSGAPFGPQCGFRADLTVTRVLVVATDAPFHSSAEGPPWQRDLASTTAELAAADVTVIGLKAPGAGTELDALATATGGSVQPLSSDGTNIGEAIVAGLSSLPIDVEMSSDCAPPIGTVFAPMSQTVTSGDDAVFTETISVAPGTAGGTYTCTDHVSYNGSLSDTVVETKTIHVVGIDLSPGTDVNELGSDLDHTVTATVTAGDAGPVAGASVTIEIVAGPNAGTSVTGVTDTDGRISLTWTPAVDPSSLGTDDIVATLFDPAGEPVASDTADKDWVDTTPPGAACVETVNPSGKNVPKAPGKGGKGQNQDGFYEILGEDVVSPAGSLQVFVTDDGSGTIFGPFAVGTRIKWTEANGAVPKVKPMGGPGSAIAWHIMGNGDAQVSVIDGAGNVGTASCLVPPAPK